MNFRILNGFKRLLIFEVSCLIFKISGQRFAKFAADLNDAIRQLGKASLECFRDVLVLSHCLTASNGGQRGWYRASEAGINHHQMSHRKLRRTAYG
jgi:hypothetical protein